MEPYIYRYTIRFRGGENYQCRYQLQISEVGQDGRSLYRAQWDFPTLKNLLTFLKRYFPNSQALTPTNQLSLGFDTVLSVVGF
ncbi:MAG: hypothetical protein HC866_07365 [Leptolyngbyaceae cyanobacterium RU_5_1]|nr:hypothetical protein [Leptolyngbyaceae cyanobacterium RU_5_1]